MLQELSDQTIAVVLSEQVNELKIDTEINPVLIGDNDAFFKDEQTDENKAYIKTLLDKANYTDILDDQYNQQKLLQGDLSVQPQPTTTSTDEKTDIKSVDEKNYDDYLKILQIYKPDLFVDEEDVIITPKTEEIDDVVPPWLRPKTEEIDDAVPTVELWLRPKTERLLRLMTSYQL